MDAELKIWEVKIYFFDIRKLIKISRNGSKIHEFEGR
jgi:hypothetical protein